MQRCVCLNDCGKVPPTRKHMQFQKLLDGRAKDQLQLHAIPRPNARQFANLLPTQQSMQPRVR